MNIQTISKHVKMIDSAFHGESRVLGTYLVKGKNALIVDPGPTASIPHLLSALKTMGLSTRTLRYIAPTHIHLDHAGGSWKLMDSFTQTRLLVHPKGVKHMIDPYRLEAGARSLFGDAVSSYGKIRGVPEKRVEGSQDGQLLDLEGSTIKLLWTPGHASHHQCLYVPEDRILILGDAGGFYLPETDITLPTTPPPFNPLQAVESLDRLIGLNPEIVCYGHFGPAYDAVRRLKAHIKQLKLWDRIVVEGIEEGLNNMEIYQRIREQDPNASRISYSLKAAERSPAVNILGFVKYHEWMQSREKRS
jgi:glyoxylase-like metal-dependent hydrolase (beta-lactamase superfamily II)